MRKLCYILYISSLLVVAGHLVRVGLHSKGSSSNFSWGSFSSILSHITSEALF